MTAVSLLDLSLLVTEVVFYNFLTHVKNVCYVSEGSRASPGTISVGWVETYLLNRTKPLLFLMFDVSRPLLYKLPPLGETYVR